MPRYNLDGQTQPSLLFNVSVYYGVLGLLPVAYAAPLQAACSSSAPYHSAPTTAQLSLCLHLHHSRLLCHHSRHHYCHRASHGPGTYRHRIRCDAGPESGTHLTMRIAAAPVHAGAAQHLSWSVGSCDMRDRGVLMLTLVVLSGTQADASSGGCG